MKARSALPFLAAALMIAASGCGQSPLLHHENARKPELTLVETPDAGAANPSPNVNTPAPRPACQLSFPKSGLCASLTWDEPPTGDAENSFTLRFDHEVDGDVAVQLWMPSMGHGSSPVKVTTQGGGAYAVTRVYFIMPGAWDIRVQIKKNQQIVEQAILGVSI